MSLSISVLFDNGVHIQNKMNVRVCLFDILKRSRDFLLATKKEKSGTCLHN